MAKTDLHMNWSSVTVQPPSPAALITLTGVTSISIDGKDSLEYFYGDAYRFPRCVRSVTISRTVTISTGNLEGIMQIPEGKPCTITAVLDDALNGSGEGSLHFSIKNAMRETGGFDAANNKFASGKVTFTCFGDADDADPVSYTVGS